MERARPSTYEKEILVKFDNLNRLWKPYFPLSAALSRIVSVFTEPHNYIITTQLGERGKLNDSRFLDSEHPLTHIGVTQELPLTPLTPFGGPNFTDELTANLVTCHLKFGDSLASPSAEKFKPYIVFTNTPGITSLNRVEMEMRKGVLVPLSKSLIRSQSDWLKQMIKFCESSKFKERETVVALWTGITGKVEFNRDSIS